MKVRVTGILIENGSMLLLDQDVDDYRSWSLPGGTLEEGETLEQALKREMKEETSLDVEVGNLLYICDHITDGRHVLHLTFLVKRVGGELGKATEDLDINKIRNIAFVPISELTDKGFDQKFQELALNDFPDPGSYMGSKSAIGL